jgi:hypothetical protein
MLNYSCTSEDLDGALDKEAVKKPIKEIMPDSSKNCSIQFKGL